MGMKQCGAGIINGTSHGYQGGSLKCITMVLEVKEPIPIYDHGSPKVHELVKEPSRGPCLKKRITRSFACENFQKKIETKGY
jgi:hypothetical protein